MLSWESFLKRYDIILFLKQAKVGAEWTSTGKSFQTMGASEVKLLPKCILIYVKMDRIKELPRTNYLDGCIVFYIFYNEQKKENQGNWDDHC